MARKPVRLPPASTPGERNSRLDAFVDAAFAFAVTLLVISADRIPGFLYFLLASTGVDTADTRWGLPRLQASKGKG